MVTTQSKLVLCDFPADTGEPRWPSFSPFVTEVACALRFARLPFEHRKLPILEVRRVNAITGQLPVLMIGDELLADSTRILRRIDEQLAPGALTKGLDRRSAGEAWLWEEFSDTALYPQVLATRWADERGWPVPRKAFFSGLPPVVRDVVATMVRRKTLAALVGRDFTRAGLGACEERLYRVLDELDARAPRTGFWMGSEPCVADIGLFAQLHSLRLPHTAFRVKDIAARTHVSNWLDRVEAAIPAQAQSTLERAPAADDHSVTG